MVEKSWELWRLALIRYSVVFVTLTYGRQYIVNDPKVAYGEIEEFTKSPTQLGLPYESYLYVNVPYEISCQNRQHEPQGET